MSNEVQIKIPMGFKRETVSQDPATMLVSKNELLRMIRTYRSAEVVLHAAGLDLGQVDHDDGSALHFLACAADERTQDETDVIEKLKSQVASLRTAATAVKVSGVESNATTSTSPSTDTTDALDPTTPGPRIASALARCPSVVEIEGQRIALGTTSSGRQGVEPSNSGALTYTFMARERHFVSKDRKHIRCIADPPAATPIAGETLRIRVAHESHERIVNVDDIDDDDKQLGWKFDASG